MSLKVQPTSPVGLNEFRTRITEESFTAVTRFMSDIALKPIKCCDFKPDQKLRDLLTMIHFHLVPCVGVHG